ncbi:hypothetical protein D3C79_139940 [compost metagenome]
MNNFWPAAFFIFITNIVGFGLFKFRYSLLPNVNFVDHLDGLGSALASYATAMMALVFALIAIFSSLDNDNIKKFKAYGYMKATYAFYFTCFLELGVTLLLSILCLSNFQSYYIASLALVFGAITFLQVVIIVMQIILLSLKV